MKTLCSFSPGFTPSMSFPLSGHGLAPLSLTLLALLFGGCGSDASLRVAPELEEDSEMDSTCPLCLPSDRQGTGGGVDSPWANLDPGELPDVVFAVAWVDLTEGCVNCYYAPDAPDRYDIVDPLGQVLSSFDTPFDWSDSSYYPPPLRSLEASGPGRFMISNLIQGMDEVHQVVWEADAYTNEARVLARVYARRVELPQTGELLLLGQEMWPWGLRVVPDPIREGALLLVPTSNSPYVQTGMQEVWSVPYDDVAAPVRRWSFAEFGPHFMDEEWPGLEHSGLARLADDGSGRLVVGFEGWGANDEGEPEYQVELAAFLPESESELEIRRDPVPGDLMHPAARVVPGSGESPAIVLAPPYGCGGPLLWWEGGVTTEIRLPDGDSCPVLGPLLDLPSRTFIYSAWYGDEEYPEAHRMVVNGAGQELWSIDRLRRGLSERPFHLLGAAALTF